VARPPTGMKSSRKNFIPRHHKVGRSREHDIPGRGDALSGRAQVPAAMLGRWWTVVRETASQFIADEALSRGAAIAFYVVTSIGPVLLIVVAIAGLAFGEDTARDAIVAQFRGVMGQQSAELLQTVIKNASGKSAGIWATIVGAVTLLVAASGVFSEMQAALNAFWKVEQRGTTLGRLVRARAASLGLVVAMGFLLMVSLVVSAGLAALSGYVNAWIPFGSLVLSALNFLISLALISALFAAIYKALPDKVLQWRDVIVGAIVTALLFNLGKMLVGFYIGSSAIASSYGAAGALIILLLWIYYSTQIFLLGAEFTKVYAAQRGSQLAAGLERSGLGNESEGREGHSSAAHVASGPRLKPAWRLLAAFFLLRAASPRRHP
jgi:membrane protein